MLHNTIDRVVYTRVIELTVLESGKSKARVPVGLVVW
jgi:hypothetical protein